MPLVSTLRHKAVFISVCFVLCLQHCHHRCARLLRVGSCARISDAFTTRLSLSVLLWLRQRLLRQNQSHLICCVALIHIRCREMIVFTPRSRVRLFMSGVSSFLNFMKRVSNCLIATLLPLLCLKLCSGSVATHFLSRYHASPSNQLLNRQ